MWPTLIFGFLAGVFGANGVPHFVKGITKESYPCLLGNGPVMNLVAGWLMGVFAVVMAFAAQAGDREIPALAAGAAGALAMGWFHAYIGAFGKKQDR